MVGPIGEEERRSGMRRLKVALVLVVGASAGLITLQGNVSPLVTAVAVGGGLGVGAALAWYVFPGGEYEDADRRRRR